MAERLALLKRSWNHVAAAYDRELTPRFQPWADNLLHRFSSHSLSPGSIYVPACGPGRELVALAQRFPDHDITGVDLSETMVDLANSLLTNAGLSTRARAIVGDACRLPHGAPRPAGMYTMFGLQQLPSPGEVLRGWLEGLAPGGLLAVCYWPSPHMQSDIRWRQLTDPSRMLAPAGDAATRAPGADAGPAWDDDIAGIARAGCAEVLGDEWPSHDMHFCGPDDFFEVMVHAGPLQSRLQLMGPEHMAALRSAFLASFGEQRNEPFVVKPRARMLLLRRRIQSAM